MGLREGLEKTVQDVAIGRVGALVVGIVSLGVGLFTLCLSWESGLGLVDSGLDEVRLVLEA